MTVARRYLSRIVLTAGLGFLLSVQAVHAQQQPIPDVEAQFNALSFRPDPLGFDIANSPDPTTCKHYEGIARLQGADGTPYFVLTRSGALDKLRINDPQAAIVKLDQTLDSLRSAQAAGATVGTLIALVEQVMASLL